MEHLGTWLQAYHDGELDELQLRRVEAHLAECAACRAELDVLQSLSSLLQAAPPVSGTLPEQRFVAEVGLRLARRPERTPAQQALLTGWRLIPVALVGIWIFVQAVTLISNGLVVAAAVGAGEPLFGALFAPATSSWVDRLLGGMAGLGAREIYVEALRLLPFELVLTWGTVLNLVLPLVIGLAFWSWLASFWVRAQPRRAEI